MNIKEKLKNYLFKKYYKFPCKQCIVSTTCKDQLCDQLNFNNEELRQIVKQVKGCPDCGSEQFYEGPCGGLSQNIQCSKCGHWFNTTVDCLIFERIHVDPVWSKKVVNG